MRKFLVLLLMAISISLFSQEQEVQLRWNASTDNVGVAGYNIWLNGDYYGTTSDTTFVLSLEIGTHLLAVSAFDAAGNESGLSEILIVEIEDKQSPTIPDSLMIVYPNPTYGDFVVQFGMDMETDFTVQIIGATGRIHYQRVIGPVLQFDEERFNLRGQLVAGMYILAVIQDNIRLGYKHIVVIADAKQIMTDNEDYGFLVRWNSDYPKFSSYTTKN